MFHDTPRARRAVRLLTLGAVAVGLDLLLWFGMSARLLHDYLGWPWRGLYPHLLLATLALGCLVGLWGCVEGLRARKREQARGLAPLSYLLAPVFLLGAGINVLGVLVAGIGHGRPYRLAGKPARARAQAGTGWATATSLDTSRLTATERAALSKAYLAAGLAEHASIASFAQLSLELMALGAPPALLARCHEAALDEVRHAQVCFGLASRFAGRALEPAGLPQQTGKLTRVTLEQVAVGSLLDGWLNESVAAGVLAQMSAQCTNLRMARALGDMAEEERRHAELGRDIVRFCLHEGGERVARMLTLAFERTGAHAWGRGEPTTLSDALREHGLVTRDQVAALAAREHAAVRTTLRALCALPEAA